MSKKYLLLLNSLEAQFSIIDTFSSFVLDYNDQNINYDLLNIEKDDMIVGYFSEPKDEATILFRVDSYHSNHLRVKKVLETEKGASITQDLKKEVLEKGLIKLIDDEYIKILNDMKNSVLSGELGLYGRKSFGSPSDKIGYNKIYYGIPGCGKSYYVEHTVLENVDKENVYRTTFYPDYTNSEFIGQIYPVVKADGRVEYEPIPGPFTKALERAYTHKDETVYLVIEELNRGNAAAIFGDTFQLLDRLEISYDGREPGDSEYPISNEFIEGYFRKNNIEYKDKQIIIPHNMVVLATMNTSDQNVFPLDTAFKRRWDRERVESDWSKNELKDLLVPGMDITWEKFANSVNYRITQYDVNGGVTFEDKQLGAYFVTKDMLVAPGDSKKIIDEKKKRFANNVIDYLFNDVVRFNHEKLFDKVDSYDSLYQSIISEESTYYGLKVETFTNKASDNESKE